MAKYDQETQNFQNQLGNAKNILIALPTGVTVDQLSAALALNQTLESQGKQTGIVCPDTIKVAHSNLYGIQKVQNKLPEAKGGNLVITLDNVVATEGAQVGTVPSLEKLDWYPEGSALNLVFHVLPGQKFEPTNISHHYQGEDYNLVITVGVNNLQELGSVYTENKELLDKASIINIDNNQNNTQYGAVNIVDPMAPSISEMLKEILSGLGATLDPDSASNLLTGIYDATHNLTAAVTADTFYAVAAALQAGGKLPKGGVMTAAPQPEPKTDWFQLNQQEPKPANANQSGQREGRHRRRHRRDDRRDRDQQLQSQNQPAQDQQPVAQPEEKVEKTEKTATPPPVVTHEEAAKGEYVQSGNPETISSPAPDWLTPKVYRGGKIE